jgi:hypothetical protein
VPSFDSRRTWSKRLTPSGMEAPRSTRPTSSCSVTTLHHRIQAGRRLPRRARMPCHHIGAAAAPFSASRTTPPTGCPASPRAAPAFVLLQAYFRPSSARSQQLYLIPGFGPLPIDGSDCCSCPCAQGQQANNYGRYVPNKSHTIDGATSTADQRDSDSMQDMD